MSFATQRFTDLNPQCRLPSTFGKYGIEPEFDNYGMNARWMWYESLDSALSCWMCGETHTYIFLDKHGDYVRHEADLGPDAFYPQPLGPRLPDLQGPRPLSECQEYGAYYGFADS